MALPEASWAKNCTDAPNPTVVGLGNSCNVARLPEMRIEKLAVCETAGVSGSVTLTVMFEDTGVVGVPLIAPVATLNVNPAGKVPPVSDHVYGAVPPVAANACE